MLEWQKGRRGLEPGEERESWRVLGITGVQSRKTRASVVRGADHVGGEHMGNRG